MSSISINNCVFMGRLTGEPEMRYTRSNKPATTFRIAVSRRSSADVTDFIPCVTYGAQAEFVSQWFQEQGKYKLSGGKAGFSGIRISRGRGHAIDFAAQNHKNRERVTRFLFFEREKVSECELPDVRVLPLQNTACRKNVSFSTDSIIYACNLSEI